MYESCIAHAWLYACLISHFLHMYPRNFTLILAKLPGLMRLCQENMEYKLLAAFVATTQLLAIYSHMRRNAVGTYCGSKEGQSIRH